MADREDTAFSGSSADVIGATIESYHSQVLFDPERLIVIFVTEPALSS